MVETLFDQVKKQNCIFVMLIDMQFVSKLGVENLKTTQTAFCETEKSRANVLCLHKIGKIVNSD